MKETAAQLKEKGYYTFSSYADTFRLYGNSIAQSWVQPGETTITVDQKIMDWVNDVVGVDKFDVSFYGSLLCGRRMVRLLF